MNNFANDAAGPGVSLQANIIADAPQEPGGVSVMPTTTTGTSSGVSAIDRVKCSECRQDFMPARKGSTLCPDCFSQLLLDYYNKEILPKESV